MGHKLCRAFTRAFRPVACQRIVIAMFDMDVIDFDCLMPQSHHITGLRAGYSRADVNKMTPVDIRYLSDYML